MKKLAITALSVIALAGFSSTVMAEITKTEVTVEKLEIKVPPESKANKDKTANCCNEPAEEI